MSTPRDRGNIPRGQQRGDPSSGAGQPQQGGTPWYQQRPVRGYQAPASGPKPAGPQHWRPTAPSQRAAPAPAPANATPKSGNSGVKALLIASAIVAALAVGVIAAAQLPRVLRHETRNLDIVGVQNQVQQVLLDRITGYRAGDISNVKCNNGLDPTVKKGGSFNCDVTVRGKQHQLTVTFPDDSGAFEVGVPQLGGGK